MADLATSVSQLTALKRLGPRIAIDDFGTGYSSLAYVHQLPIDAVKIDRIFINRMAIDDTAASLVDNIIQLTHTLGLDAVAEGVETLKQLALLKTMGCDYAQGFYLDRPAPAKHITTALERQRMPRRRRDSLTRVPARV